jgi:uncharacterized protein YyaL (SSP411 family)
MLCALDFSFGPSQEIVIVGDPQAKDTKTMIDILRSEFIPNSVWLQVSIAETKPQISQIASFTADLKSLGGKATAYVCTNYACNNPTTDPQKMLDLLK